MHTFHGIELLPASKRPVILRAMEAVLASARIDELHVVIAFVDDDEMQELNATWRNKDRPTDVLSFANWDGPPMPGAEHELGDLVISVDTMQRQAREMGHSAAVEGAVLVAHGLLHLLGLDHERSFDEAVRQAECEMTLLAGAGLSPAAALLGRSFE